MFIKILFYFKAPSSPAGRHLVQTQVTYKVFLSRSYTQRRPDWLEVDYPQTDPCHGHKLAHYICEPLRSKNAPHLNFCPSHNHMKTLRSKKYHREREKRPGCWDFSDWEKMHDKIKSTVYARGLTLSSCSAPDPLQAWGGKKIQLLWVQFSH